MKREPKFLTAQEIKSIKKFIEMKWIGAKEVKAIQRIASRLKRAENKPKRRKKSVHSKGCKNCKGYIHINGCSKCGRACWCYMTDQERKESRKRGN